jgi:hypothetical protein
MCRSSRFRPDANCPLQAPLQLSARLSARRCTTTRSPGELNHRSSRVRAGARLGSDRGAAHVPFPHPLWYNVACQTARPDRTEKVARPRYLRSRPRRPGVHPRRFSPDARWRRSMALACRLSVVGSAAGRGLLALLLRAKNRGIVVVRLGNGWNGRSGGRRLLRRFRGCWRP